MQHIMPLHINKKIQILIILNNKNNDNNDNKGLYF